MTARFPRGVFKVFRTEALQLGEQAQAAVAQLHKNA
jgi:hypothetical protein